MGAKCKKDSFPNDTPFSYAEGTLTIDGSSLDLESGIYYGIKRSSKTGFSLIQSEGAGPAEQTLNLNTLQCFYSASDVNGDAVVDIIGTVDFRDARISGPGMDENYNYILLSLAEEGDSILFIKEDESAWSILLYNSATSQTCSTACDNCARTNADFQNCLDGQCSEAEVSSKRASVSSPEDFEALMASYHGRGNQLKPLCSHDGEIREVFLMNMVTKEYGLDTLLKNFEGIFKGMGPNIRYYILLNHEAGVIQYPDIEKRFAQQFSGDEYKDFDLVLIAPMDYCALLEQGMLDEIDNTIDCDPDKLLLPEYWAQDPISVLRTEGGMPILMEPLQFNNFVDYFISSELSARTGMLSRTAPFGFNSGNHLAGKDYLVLGADAKALAYNSMFGSFDAGDLPNFDSLPDLDSLFKEVFGVEDLVWIGEEELSEPIQQSFQMEAGTFQPVYHIDLFLTLAGRVSTTDPRELVFVGIPEVVNPKGLPYDTLQFGQFQAEVRKVVRQLEAAQIGGRRFLVDSIPLPVLVNNLANSKETVGTLCSFNNCQVEIGADRKRIFLPTYYVSKRLHAITQDAMDKFEGYGFEVTRVNGHFARTSVLEDASLHCMTKVLRRGPK